MLKEVKMLANLIQSLHLEYMCQIITPSIPYKYVQLKIIIKKWNKVMGENTNKIEPPPNSRSSLLEKLQLPVSLSVTGKQRSRWHLY